MNILKKYLILSALTISLVSGSLNPVENQNYMFWVLGQGFFSGYYQSSATFAGMGDHSYIFTEDALIRDIAGVPGTSDKILTTTNSGVFLTLDGGNTWTAVNGSGAFMIPEQPEANLTNISGISEQHRQMVMSIAVDTLGGSETWWTGLNDNGLYRSTDEGIQWRDKSTGLPSFDGNRPDIYTIIILPDDAGLYTATYGGIFNRTNTFTAANKGFPEPATADWPSIPVYDAVKYENEIIMATEFGLYRGSIEHNLADKLPFGSGMGIIDTAFQIFKTEEIADSAKTEYFTWDWDTGDTSWVYDYFTTIDTLSSHLGLGISTLSSLNAEIEDGLSVNVMDVVDSTYWKSQAVFDENLDMLVVELKNDYVYQYDSDNFDPNQPDSVNYNFYLTSNYLCSDYLAYCTDDSFLNQEACEEAGWEWIIMDFTNQVDCENAGFEWFEGETINYNQLTIHLTKVEPVYNLAVDSNNNVYYTTDSGVFSYSGTSGELQSYGLSGFTINDLTISNDGTQLYAASSAGVLSYDLSAGDNWSGLSPKISTLNTGDSIHYMATAVMVTADNEIYAGCGNSRFADPRTVTYRTGGVLKSMDNGYSWNPVNNGLTHRSINQENVTDIITAFEDSTNADSSRGIFELLTTWYGEVPDVDEDDHVIILIADLGDNSYNSTSDLILQGYFNAPDQSSPISDPNSNQLDMIYIDSDPQDPSLSMEGIARGLSRLIAYNYDPNEEEWVLTGLEHFAPYIIGHKTAPEGDIYTIENNNSLLYGDSSSRQKEYDQLFTLIVYLSEHYLTDDPFGAEFEFNTSLSALIQNNLAGVEGLNDVIKNATNNETVFTDVFTNWALAVHFDNIDPELNNGLYGFENIAVSVSPSTYPWGETSGQSPYQETIKNWSAKYMQTEKWVNGSDKSPAFNQETLMFNAFDASDIQLAVIKQIEKAAKDTSADISFPDFDSGSNRVVYSDWSDFGGPSSESLNKYQYFALVAVCREAGTDAGGNYVVHDDVVSLDVTLQINQNSLLLNYLDVYTLSDGKAYGDGGSGSEGPAVLISDGTETISSFDLSEFFIDDGGYVYQNTFNIESLLPVSTSEFLFISSAESIGGDKAEADTTIIMVMTPDESLERVFSSDWNNFTIEFSEYDLNPESLLMVITDDDQSLVNGMTALSSSLNFTQSTIYNETEITLEFEIPEYVNNSEYEFISILYDNGNEIQNLPAAIHAGKIKTQIQGDGYYQLVLGTTHNNNLIPGQFALYQNFPNPFNPISNIRFNVPYQSNVRLRIFDIRGREIISLINKQMDEGIYSVKWDGKNSFGKISASGIYFYQLQTEEITLFKKMVLMK